MSDGTGSTIYPSPRNSFSDYLIPQKLSRLSGSSQEFGRLPPVQIPLVKFPRKRRPYSSPFFRRRNYFIVEEPPSVDSAESSDLYSNVTPGMGPPPEDVPFLSSFSLKRKGSSSSDQQLRKRMGTSPTEYTDVIPYMEQYRQKSLESILHMQKQDG